MDIGTIEGTLALRDQASATMAAFASSAAKSFQSASAEAQKTGLYIDKLDAAIAKLANDQATAATNATLQTNAIRELGGVTRLTADQQKELSKVVKDGLDAYKALGRDAPNSIKALGKELEAVEAKTKAAADATKAWETVIKTAKATATAFSAAFVAGFGAVLAASTKMAVDFETSFQKIGSLTEATADDLNLLRDAALKLGPSLGQGPKEMADALYNVASVGFQGAEAIEVVTVAAKGAAIGLGSVADLTKLTTAAISAYGKENLTAKDAMEVLLKTVKLGNVEAAELSTTMGRIVGTTAAAGISFADAGAFIATFTKQGVSAAEAVTSLNQITAAILSPTTQMLEGFKQAGLNFEEFRKASKSAEQGGIGLAGALNMLVEKVGGSAEKISDLFGNIRALRGVLGTAATQGIEYARVQEIVAAKSNEVDKAFNKVKESAAFKWNVLKGEVQATAITFGEALLPALKAVFDAAKPIIEVVKELAEWFAKLPAPVQAAVLGMTLMAGAAPAVVSSFDSILRILSPIGGLLSTSLGIPALATAFTAALPVMAVAAAGIGAAILVTFNNLQAALARTMADFARAKAQAEGNKGGVTGPSSQIIDPEERKKAEEAEQKRVLIAAQVAAANEAVAASGIKVKRVTVDLTAAQVDYVEKLKFVQAEVAGLTKTQKDQIDAFSKVGGKMEDLIIKTGASEAAIRMYQSSTKAATKEAKEFGKVVGDDVLKSASEAAIAITKLGGVNRLTADQQKEINKLFTEAVNIYKARGVEIPKVINDIQAATLDWSLGMKDSDVAMEALTGKIPPLVAEYDEYGKKIKEVENAQLKLMLAQMEGILSARELGKALSSIKAPEIGIIRDPLGNLGKGGSERLKQDAGAFGEVEDAAKKAERAAREFDQALGDISRSLSELGDMIGGTTGKVLNDFANIASAVQDAGRAGDQFVRGFEKGLGGIADMAAGVLSGIAAIGKATSSTNRATNVAGGALAGAQLGAKIGAIAGPMGAAIGAGVGAAAGAIVGALRGRGMREEIKRVGKEWGVTISGELAKEIDKMSKSLGGNRQLAELLSFDKILEEAGGLNEVNFDGFLAKFRDIFVAVETGRQTIPQAMDFIAKNFQGFADQVLKSGKIASDAFVEVLRLNARMGVNAPEILDFVRGQTARAGGGVADLAGPLVTQFGGLAGKIDTAKAKLKEMDAAFKTVQQTEASGTTKAIGNSEAYLKAQNDVIKAQSELGLLLLSQATGAEIAGQEMEDLGIIALGAFNAAIEGGLNWFDALKQVGPGLDALVQLQKDLGIESENSAVQELIRVQGLVKGNESLVKAAGALDETLLALSNTGALNTDTLAAMERTGIRTFDRLVKAGFTENEALSMMGDFLEDVEEAHIKLGTPIDENTQKLIDQAREAGILKDKQKSATEIMEEGFRDLIKEVRNLVGVMKGDLPEAIRNIPKTIPIAVTFDVPDLNLPGGVTVNTGENSFASGTGGIRDFGRGTLAMLHGREAVMTERQLGAFIPRPISAMTRVQLILDGYGQQLLAEGILRQGATTLRLEGVGL